MTSNPLIIAGVCLVLVAACLAGLHFLVEGIIAVAERLERRKQ